jgi:hypothetical protein
MYLVTQIVHAYLHCVRLAGPRLTVRKDAYIVAVEDRHDKRLHLREHTLLGGRFIENLWRTQHRRGENRP